MNLENKIAPNVVVGHSFISTKRTKLTIEEIIQYCNIADSLIEPKYYVSSYNTCLENFGKNYSFLFEEIDNKLILNCDINILIRYFRLGLPKDLVKLLDEAGEKFNSLNNSENNNFDIMAIPYNKPYTISNNKVKEFLNHKTNAQIKEENNEFLKKFKLRIKKK